MPLEGRDDKPSRVRVLLILLAAILSLAPALLVRGTDAGAGIVARPLALDPAHPQARQVGALRYLGGWSLGSRDRRFGGFSAAAVDGGDLVLLSDAGWALRLRTAGDRIEAAGWQDVGAAGGKAARDSESLAHDPAAGGWWIGFEGANLIAERVAGLALSAASVHPAAMRDWPANGGAESLARLPDGRFVVIAETARLPGGARQALLFLADPTSGAAPNAFGYRPPAGYDPSDAAALPDGRLIVLNRRLDPLRGFEAELEEADLAGAAKGATLSGRSIARLAAPLTVDNMEGVAIGQEDGRTILWLVSDDNFLPIQRTLLLKFALGAPR